MPSRALTPTEIEEALASPELARWHLLHGKLHREYAFANFVDAFGFMSSAALRAEAFDHHPEWFNVYGRVVVDLVTHDAAGVTERDLRLARAMEALALGREKP